MRHSNPGCQLALSTKRVRREIWRVDAGSAHYLAKVIDGSGKGKLASRERPQNFHASGGSPQKKMAVGTRVINPVILNTAIEIMR